MTPDEFIAYLGTLHSDLMSLATKVKEMQVMVYQQSLDGTADDVLD